MSNIDKSYHKLLKTILDEGFRYEDPNRKGVHRIQIPSYQVVHNFTDGFPAITTKELYWKGVVGELLWFLRGDTNIKYLVDNGINIWNKDAYNYYKKQGGPGTLEAFIYNTKREFNLLKTGKKLGDLGKVYGAQWRHWTRSENTNGAFVDQIYNLIKGLKETPMGTRHIVTAWNPAELDDMALPPCHWSFEILVEPLSLRQRQEIAHEIKPSASDVWDTTHEILDDGHDIPKYQFTLKWHQRSVDTFLGLPFNIASYATLAKIIGKMTNMVPKGIIGDLSNVHIYEPHLDAVKEQLSRDVDKYGECELKMGDFINGVSVDSQIKDLQIGDFKLNDYKSYPKIPAEMLAYSN